MSEEIKQPENRGEGQAIANGDFMGDGPKLKDDMRLLARAARRGWKVPDAVKDAAVERLRAIAAKSTVAMPMGDAGMVQAEYPADQNAIAAIRTLATLDGLDQTDHWKQDTNDRLDEGKLTGRLGTEGLDDAELIKRGRQVASGVGSPEHGTPVLIPPVEEQPDSVRP